MLLTAPDGYHPSMTQDTLRLLVVSSVGLHAAAPLRLQAAARLNTRHLVHRLHACGTLATRCTSKNAILSTSQAVSLLQTTATVPLSLSPQLHYP
jgi:hypothetical protein